MSLPEGWEWLDEVPDAWLPPDEHRGPTGIPQLDLSIEMLSSNDLGNDDIKLVGQFVSEYAEVNMWFGREAKSQVVSPKELALLSVEANEQVRRVFDAWQLFLRACRASDVGPDARQRERQLLREALRDSIAALSVIGDCYRRGPDQ